MMSFARARTSTALAVFALGAALIGASADGDQQAPPAAVPEVLRLPPGTQLNRGMRGPMRTEVALSPDGATLVFSASPDGT